MEATPLSSLLYCCLAGLLMCISYQHFLANALSAGRLVAEVVLPPCFGAPSYLGGYQPRPEFWNLDLSLLFCCLAGLLMAISCQHFLANVSFLLGRLVAAAVLPACFGAPSFLGGYKPRPEYWDLDLDGREPILFSFRTVFSDVKAYYIPPLKPSHVQQVVVGYAGNTRSVGASMKDFWQHLGPDVHLILVNHPGYGLFEEDRSQPMTGKDDALLEPWLCASLDTLEREILNPPKIEWDQFKPHRVIKNDKDINLSTCQIDKLPRTFVDCNIIPFGRSFGANLASRYINHDKIYYMPLQSIEEIDPAGLRGIIWRLIRPWSPFPSGDSQLVLDTLSLSLNEYQRRFIKGYNQEVFTGLRSNFALDDKAGKKSLVAVASRENVVGTMDLTQATDRVTVLVIEGNHGALPDQDFQVNLGKFLDNCATAHKARRMEHERI